MYNYQPVHARPNPFIGQAGAPPAVAPPPAPITVAPVTYTGIPGFLETVAVLGVSAAAAWVGVRAGLNKGEKKPVRIAGWVGGVGSALVGLMYLGAKSGVSKGVIPGVVVVR